MDTTPDAILEHTFGYQEFRPLQREVIANVLNKTDTLTIMPTGGGKSLCYQIPALIFPGLTVVVSPLIALMKDQVEQILELGIPALYLNSSLPPELYRENMEQVRNGQCRLLYVAPETLLTPRIFNLLAETSLNCLTIDEAHCISEWGHDFRPEYRHLVEVRDRFPNAVCLALTATATPRVRKDIKSNLGFEDSNEFVASFNRENLLIEVIPKTDPKSQTIQFLRRFPNQSGIIYCFSRKQVDALSDTLTNAGYSVRPYHAGLENTDRKENQELFIRDDIQIIVATIAFGMGINKPNVRFIIHYDLPKSIESYYQEIGRAGRDGLPANCLLLYSSGDAQKVNFLINQKEGKEQVVASSHLKAMTLYAESNVCRRIPLLAYFGENYTEDNCGMCDICLREEKELVDITIPAQMFLSCVRRTGEMFGEGHVIDVLLGSENQRVMKFGHQKLSTHSIGTDLMKAQWKHISFQLFQKGLLAKDARHGSLKLSPKAVQVLRSREKIYGELLADKAVATTPGKTGVLEYDNMLFEILRKKRKELADEANVPPYVIFPDRTLIEMAAYYPMTENSMDDIYGVGSRKLVKYGPTFIEVISGYCTKHNLTEKRKSRSRRSKGTSSGRKGTKHIAVGEAYNRGASIQELAEQFNVQSGTIMNHLAKYLTEGYTLESDEFLTLPDIPSELIHQVMGAFKDSGTELLKPVYDSLEGDVNYDDLKMLRIYYLINQHKL